VGVQHCPGSGLFHDGQMQKRLGAGLAEAPSYQARSIHNDQFFWWNRALCHSARRHQQLQRFPLENTAEIAAGAFTPAPLMD
jgi:hypothetical protein